MASASAPARGAPILRAEQGARRNGATHRAETKRHLIFKCQSRPWQPSLRRAALLTPALHPKTPHHQLQRRQHLHQNSTSRRSRSGLWRCSSAMYVSCGMVVALATIHSPAGGYWAAGSSFIGRLVLLSTGEATGVGDDQGGSGGAAARRRSFGGASRVTQTQQTTRRCVAALAALCRSSAAARRCLEVRCCYSKKSPALPSAFYRVMCVPVCV